jgi:pimeloyl-ACP methyl ester carboxylesterase
MLLGLISVLVLLVAGFVALSELRPDWVYRGAIGLERSLAGLHQEYRLVDGRRWAYLEGGSGPALVLVHGFGADKDNWVRVARHLDDRFHLIVPDLIGFGDSDRPEDVAYRVTVQAERLLELLDELGIERAHFGGSSMGGAIISALAGMAPERVQSLWLLAPGGVAGAEPSEGMTRILNGQSNPLIPQTLADFKFTLEFVFEEQPFISSPIRDYLAVRQIERQGLLEQIFADLINRSRSVEELLSGYPGPALVVWGEKDRVLHASGAAVLKDLMPGAQVSLMPNTGHLPMIEWPERCADQFLAFQDSL